MTDLQRGPSPEHLRNARILISREPELQDLFTKAKTENRDAEWLADNLAVRISARWGGQDFDQALAVSNTLATEFFLNPDKGIAVIDNQTGEILGSFGPEDVYVPAALPRESGSMAQPLPRLRPEIEAALVLKKHDHARETAGLEAMLAKTTQTDLQREEGDRRLEFMTAQGRTSILEAVPGLIRTRLFEKGRAGMRPENLTALEMIARVLAKEPKDKVLKDPTFLQAETVITLSLQDKQTSNLHHSYHERIVGAILSDWARLVGSLYVARWAKAAPTAGLVMEEDTSLEDLAGRACMAWVAPAEIATRLQRMSNARVVAVPAWGPVIALIARSVTLVPELDQMEIKQIEYNDRWVIRVTTPLRVLWEPHDHFTGIRVTSPEVPEVNAEIVR
jgi:hypothetical protein